MKRYETFIIVDPDVSDDSRNQFLDRLKTVITDQKGILVLVDEWGSRKLAYEIKKKSRGYYVRLDYCGTGTLVEELERIFRIDDRIMKYMTVLLADTVDMEQIQDEIAKAAAEAAQKEAPPPSKAPETTPEETSPEETSDEEPVAQDTPDEETEEKPIKEPAVADAPEAESEVSAETQPEIKTEESE